VISCPYNSKPKKKRRDLSNTIEQDIKILHPQ
jgi:hypothetical protein